MLIAINYPVSGLKFAIVVFIVVVIAVAIVVHTCYIHPYLINIIRMSVCLSVRPVCFSSSTERAFDLWFFENAS